MNTVREVIDAKAFRRFEVERTDRSGQWVEIVSATPWSDEIVQINSGTRDEMLVGDWFPVRQIEWEIEWEEEEVLP